MDRDVPTGFNNRLIALGAVVLAFAAAVSWLSFDASSQVSDRARNLVAKHVPQLRTIGILQDSVNRRSLQLYLYYATMDHAAWRSVQSMRTEVDALLTALHTIDPINVDLSSLRDPAAEFERHALAFEREMVRSDRDWDRLREHLAEAQIAADRLSGRLTSLAASIRQRAGQGGNLTMIELNRLDRVQIVVIVVIFAVGGMAFSMLRGRVNDQAELYRRAYFDRLTQLPNRARMERDWAQRAQRHSGADEPCTLVMIKLDSYGLVISTFGHDVGDQVIHAISNRLKQACAQSDKPRTLYQFAAAKWLVVLEGVSSAEYARGSGRSILDSLDELLVLDEHELTVTCSAGITYYPDHGATVDELLRNGNAALQRAQAAGGSRAMVYNPRMQRQSERFVSIESAMRKGLANDEFELFYQPKIALPGRTCSGAEALIRWRRDGELVSPARFIPVAEESGLILRLGQWVLEEACRQWRAWSDAGLAPPPVAVNVSAQQFQSADFIDRVAASIAASGVPPHMLELEITEEATFEDPDIVATTMEAIKGLGVGLALDDFGTGYSSLSCLTLFPLDVIKIDQKFVRDMQTSARSMTIVEVVVAMSRELGFQVVAEGVENREQETCLHGLGCHLLQGYLYSAPVPAQDFAALLQANTRFAPVESDFGKTQPLRISVAGTRSA